ncbi:hypothetical protein [Bradyrhizobium sp. CCBAU 45394]|uniref:hypothetical protein n=1 Tax=Bradyrhizobium sp. CCBAU 45394 TaxID=1325087 RepID=UPI00230455A7|nr:hypothetical protein [Bradyrhizobium sp. CCBAU 45394]
MGLFSIFSNDDAEEAAKQRNAGLQTGYDQLSNLYGQGRDALSTNYGNASNLYAPLVASTGAGAKAYGDASGANGVAGLQSAMDTFKNSGQYGNYGFALTQGLQALDRTHAAAGNLSSGNADTDTLGYATNLANNTYSNYLSGLSPYLSANNSAVSGAAGIDTGLGNALNASYTGQGNAANTTQTAIGNSNAAATLNNYNTSANLWNGLMGAAGAASGAFGGGLGSSLFGAFSGSADGGTASNPLPGLSKDDYGAGAGLFVRFGLS